MDTIFFSKENYRRIRDIINTSTKKELGFSIRNNKMYKKKIIDIMKYLYVNRHNMDIPIHMDEIDKSRYLSQKTIKFFLLREKTKYIEEVEEPKKVTNDTELAIRPEVILKKDNRNIVNDYDNLLQSREIPKQQAQQIDFRDKTDEFNNIDIKNKYEAISKQRELEYANMGMDNQSEINHDNNIQMLPNSIMGDDMTSDYQELQNFNESEDETKGYNQSLLDSFKPLTNDIENVVLPSNDIPLKKEPKPLIVDKTPETLFTDTFKREMSQMFFALKDNANLKTNTYDITLDTRDAPGLTGQDSRYEIDINFTGNPNPLTTDKILYVPNNLRNIHSIKIKRIIIDTIAMSRIPAFAQEEIAEQPFIYAQLENYDSNVITSNPNLKNIFAKLIYDGTVPYIPTNVPDLGAGFIHFINMDNNEKIFKTPLVKLDKMKLKLLKPNGDPFKINSEIDLTYILEVKTLENYIPKLEYPRF